MLHNAKKNLSALQSMTDKNQDTLKQDCEEKLNLATTGINKIKTGQKTCVKAWITRLIEAEVGAIENKLRGSTKENQALIKRQNTFTEAFVNVLNTSEAAGKKN